MRVSQQQFGPSSRDQSSIGLLHMYRVRIHASNITALRPGHAKLKRLLIRSTALNMSNAVGLLGAGHVLQTGQSSCATTKHKGYKLFSMLGQTSPPARCHTLWHGHGASRGYDKICRYLPADGVETPVPSVYSGWTMC